MNLKSRVEKLEAATSHIAGSYCLVIHGDDYHASKAEAVTEFLARYGYEPVNFIDVTFIGADTRRSICDCSDDESVRECRH